MYHNLQFIYLFFQLNKDGKIEKMDTRSILKSFHTRAKDDVFKVYSYHMNFHTTNSAGILSFFLFSDKLNPFLVLEDILSCYFLGLGIMNFYCLLHK